MTAKFTAARREAFFRALERTGNQALAAEHAKVSRSWVTLHRSTDPAFAQRIDAALAMAKAALDGSAGSLPADKRLRWQDGNELVVRGTGGAGGGKRTQIARSRVKQWSPRAEQRFLTALTATCNVKAACAEVGLTPASAYGHRRRWPGFQRAWDDALETGYIQIEHGLIDAACNFLSPAEFPDVPPIRGMTVDQAIHLLHMHKHQVLGLGKRPGLLGRPPKMEDVRKSILSKIDAIERWEAKFGRPVEQEGKPDPGQGRVNWPMGR